MSQEIDVVGGAKLGFVGGNFEVVLFEAFAEGAEWMLATWAAGPGSKTMTSRALMTSLMILTSRPGEALLP